MCLQAAGRPDRPEGQECAADEAGCRGDPQPVWALCARRAATQTHAEEDQVSGSSWGEYTAVAITHEQMHDVCTMLFEWIASALAVWVQ